MSIYCDINYRFHKILPSKILFASDLAKVLIKSHTFNYTLFSQPLWNKNLNCKIIFTPSRGGRHLSHKTEDAYHNFIKRF